MIPWLAILLGIFIPLILIILLILAFVYRKKIPFMKDVVSNRRKQDDAISPPPISTATLSKCIEDHKQSGEFNQLFMKLKGISVTGLEHEYHLTKNAAEMNSSLNRYVDMVPYDQSLVMLGHPWPEITDNLKPQVEFSKLETFYINASYIRRPRYSPNGGEATIPGADTPPEYIATQGPLPDTVVDFLTMVCEQKSPLIVMLCLTEEKGKPKCSKYWPDKGSQDYSSSSRKVRVTLMGEEQCENWCRRQLRIEIPDKAQTWDTTHIHFSNWPDYGAPPVEIFYNLVLAHVDVRKQYPLGLDYGPTIVHCSAGVGRTGTLIAGRFLLDQLRKNNQTTDIFGTVLALRKWRANLVQATPQFQFLYEFVQYCLGRERGHQPLALPRQAPPPPDTNNEGEYMNIVGSGKPNTTNGKFILRTIYHISNSATLVVMFHCRLRLVRFSTSSRCVCL
ncbi:unnamed protein product [Mesocestoides corti]|uniref:Protein-tyrosine-phosphatase n=1 Tax=Mesocestoides corti TaxID=53468 RepID=A0A3P6HW81_MESCO|nr:unnamed protein product [Mesocestoides corti]